MRISFLLILNLAVSWSGWGQPASRGVTKLGQLSYNDKINDVWGYVDSTSGKEYALVGVESGLSIVDVDSAQNPQQVLFIPGANSVWRDMKSYSHYAYAVHDIYTGNSDGITIVDMNTLGNTFPTYWNRNPSISYQGSPETFLRAHNIYIDEKGFLYCFGSNIGQGGALIFDLKPDPTNPTFVGMFDQYYLHDGVARGDTLWGAGVYRGFFNVVSVVNKSNPQILASQTTPLNFTHNIWFSDDNQRVFTTDERTGAYIAEYDVSDLNNITELDRIRSRFGNDIIPHNTHFFNNFLVNSYYTAGLQIVDVQEPGIMLETAWYDTSPFTGDGFSGAWGAFPYLPSGNILVTDRDEGLFVLESSYPRGCYFRMHVTDSVSGQNLLNVQVDFFQGGPSGTTDIFGNYRNGVVFPDTLPVAISKAGYTSDTLQLVLQSGTTQNLSIELVPLGFDLAEYGSLSHLQIYPLPAREEVNLMGMSPQTQNLDYSFFTLQGQMLAQGRLTVDGGRAKLPIPLSPGYYLLDLRDGKEGQKRLKIQVMD